MAVQAAGGTALILSLATPVPMVAPISVGMAAAGASLICFGARLVCVNRNPFDPKSKAPAMKAITMLKKGITDFYDALPSISTLPLPTFINPRNNDQNNPSYSPL